MFTDLLKPEYGIAGFILVVTATLIWRLIVVHANTIKEMRLEDLAAHKEKALLMDGYIKGRDAQFQLLLTNHLEHSQIESEKLRASHDRLVEVIERLSNRL